MTGVVVLLGVVPHAEGAAVPEPTTVVGTVLLATDDEDRLSRLSTSS